MQEIEPLIFSKQTCYFYMAAYFANFTKAASYLHVEPSAISHAVRLLEKRLEATLFDRQHRGVKLTDKGRLLFESLQISQASIELTVEEIRSQKTQSQVVLAISNATAINVILPSLSYFKARYPQIEIRCIVSDFDADLVADHIDLAISLGPGLRSDSNQHWWLTHEKVYAVASPQFIERLTVPIRTPYDLARERLIHLTERKKTAIDWRDWFNYFDQSIPLSQPTIACNDYSIVLQMAVDGQGIAIGWEHLVAPLIEQNKLVKVIPDEVVTNEDFYLITHHSNPLPNSVELLKNWILYEVFHVTEKRN